MGVELTNFKLDLPSTKLIEFELVVTLCQVHLTKLPVAVVHHSDKSCATLRDQYNTADRVFSRQRFRLTLGIRTAVSIDCKGMVPEGALNFLSVRGHHILRGLAIVPRLCEGLDHLPVARVVVPLVPALCLGITGIGLVPDVANVVAFGRIVPCLNLDHVGLVFALQEVRHANFEVLFTPAVPVLPVVVFEV